MVICLFHFFFQQIEVISPPFVRLASPCSLHMRLDVDEFILKYHWCFTGIIYLFGCGQSLSKTSLLLHYLFSIFPSSAWTDGLLIVDLQIGVDFKDSCHWLIK